MVSLSFAPVLALCVFPSVCFWKSCRAVALRVAIRVPDCHGSWTLSRTGWHGSVIWTTQQSPFGIFFVSIFPAIHQGPSSPWFTYTSDLIGVFHTFSRIRRKWIPKNSTDAVFLAQYSVFCQVWGSRDNLSTILALPIPQLWEMNNEHKTWCYLHQGRKERVK